MDELVIGEKKYISSKQAAKITGYAKDYIGQLCREGRVPARLVGRSWYVLETAIQDHRFGEANTQADVNEVHEPTSAQSTWESPRYEALKVEELPVITPADDNLIVSRDNPVELHQNLHDSWKAWFDTVKTEPEEDKQIPDVEPEPEKPEESPEDEAEGTVVPIRAINMPAYHPLPDELLPRRMQAQKGNDEPLRVSMGNNSSKGLRRLAMALSIFGGLAAITTVALATLGSGILDQYISGHNRIDQLAGISVFRR
jgi:hypothetical protein